MNMILVGATHVGSIHINFCGDFVTNQKNSVPGIVENYRIKPANLKAADEVGLFKMGSTVVLIFEVPKGFEFTVGAGEFVRYGQVIGKAK
jgi:phosphatidylserine decarboxylase